MTVLVHKPLNVMVYSAVEWTAATGSAGDGVRVRLGSDAGAARATVTV